MCVSGFRYRLSLLSTNSIRSTDRISLSSPGAALSRLQRLQVLSARGHVPEREGNRLCLPGRPGGQVQTCGELQLSATAGTDAANGDRRRADEDFAGHDQVSALSLSVFFPPSSASLSSGLSLSLSLSGLSQTWSAETNLGAGPVPFSLSYI